MTVIAFDGNYVAADSAGFRGDLRLPWPMRKIEIRPKEGLVFGHSGLDSTFDVMIDWYLAGHKMVDMIKSVDDIRSCLMVFDRKDPQQVAHYATDCGGPNLSRTPWAWGGGKDIAGAALLCGKNALQAVELACRLHPWCGGPVQAVDLRTLEWLTISQRIGLLG